jgi:antitoxin component of MazEF toxin-antitoxin module
MPHATIGRWGKSLALRLPSEVAGEFRRHEGDRLNIESQPDQIVIRRSIDTLVRPVLCAG